MSFAPLISSPVCVQASNTQHPTLGSKRKFFPTDVLSQARAHCQGLLPRKGYPADELGLDSLTFRKGSFSDAETRACNQPAQPPRPDLSL